MSASDGYDEVPDLYDVDVDAWHDAYDDDYVEAARAEAAERERAVEDATWGVAYARDYDELRASAATLIDDAVAQADEGWLSAAYYEDHRESTELHRHAERLRALSAALGDAHELQAVRRAVELLAPECTGRLAARTEDELRALVVAERAAHHAEATAALALAAVADARRHPPTLLRPDEATHDRRRRVERCLHPPGLDRPAASPRQATAPPADLTRGRLPGAPVAP